MHSKIILLLSALISALFLQYVHTYDLSKCSLIKNNYSNIFLDVCT